MCLPPKRKNETGEPGFYKGGMISARLSVRIRGALYAQDENKKKRIKALCGAARGTIKRSHAFKRHILTKKSAKNKRQLRGSVSIHAADVHAVRAMLPFV